MIDLTSTISPKGIKLFELVKALGSVEAEDFIDQCEGPFLLQVPLEGQVIPEAQPASAADPTQRYDGADDPSGTMAISRSSIMKLQRSQNVGDAILHLLLNRGDGKKVSIGRADDCDVVLGEGTVSKKHAELSSSLGNYLLSDLGSHNGTFVDGKRLEPNQPQTLEGMQNLWFSSYRAVFLLPEQLHKLARSLGKR